MSNAEEVQRRVAEAQTGLKTATDNRNQAATLLGSLDDTFDARRRATGDETAFAGLLGQLDSELAGWKYTPEDAPVPFDGLNVESTEDAREALDDAFEGRDRRRYSRLLSEFQSVLLWLESGDQQDREARAELFAGLRGAFEDGDKDEFGERRDELESQLAEADLSDVDLKELHERLTEQFETALAVLDAQRRQTELGGLKHAFENRDTDVFEQHFGQFASATQAVAWVATARRRKFETLKEVVVEQYPEGSDESLALLDGDAPILALPVRLETRFRQDDEGWKLLIRVYPDDVHVDAHEPELTPDEIEWGIYFWRQLWWSAHGVKTTELSTVVPSEYLDADQLDGLPEDPETRHDAVKERVWGQLVERYGTKRAGWVKRALAPPNADELLDAPNQNAVPTPPDFDALRANADRRPASWTRSPRAELLPDRWTAIAEIDGDEKRVHGQPIREPLGVAPDPNEMGGAGTESPASAGVGELAQGEMDWLFDFESAKAVGMGLELSLTEAEINQGIDRLLVVGVRGLADANDSASSVRGLLDAHHYTDGLGFLPQGTPTNNTEAESSGYESRPSAGETVGVECSPPLVSAGDRSDGDVTARLLGLSPDQLASDEHVFGHVTHADATDQRDARQMNTALWSATLGYFVPHMLAGEDQFASPDLPRREFVSWLDSYRSHFVDYVRAGGPLPVIRVGEQPYGILPTTDLSAWRPIEGLEEPEPEEPPEGEFTPRRLPIQNVESDLVGRIQALRRVWERALGNVPTVHGGGDPGEGLVNLLGMEGIAHGYRMRRLVGQRGLLKLRTGQDPEYTETELDMFADSDVYVARLLDFFENQDDHIREAVAQFGTSDDFLVTPRIARLVFSTSHAQPLEPLVDEDAGTYMRTLTAKWMDTSSLKYGRPGTGRSEWYEPAMFARGTHLYWLYVLSMGRWEATLLDLLLYYALIHEYVLARIRLGELYWNRGQDLERRRPHPGLIWSFVPEPEYYADRDVTIWDLLDQLVPWDLTREHPQIEENATYDSALRNHPEIDDSFREFRQSLGYLADRDPEILERLLRETLGLASHRLDAWTTSVATRRLRQIRATDGESVGLHVGGYGVVENLEPREDATTGGYLHAPSLPQATTAAVLRSGYEASDGERRDLLSVDLSADRVRTAKTLLDGVRRGQPPGALLGYAFERGLHESSDAELDKFVPAFRKLAPLVAGKLDHGEGDSKPIDEDAVAARDVVDGIELDRKWKNGQLPWGEQVGSGGTAVRLPSEDDANPEYTAIQAVRDRLRDHIDALNDVLTAESVHQFANGNPDRAAGSLDALSRGDHPTEPEVIETPRTGTGVTHRLLVLLGDDSGGTEWPTTDRHVRATAEPYLETWASRFLGDPGRIYCLAEYTAIVAEEPDPGETELPREERAIGVSLAELELSALDVLAVTEGDEDAQRSELEQRAVYHLQQELADELDPKAEIRLSFGEFADWSHDPASVGVDPEASVTFGELLEVARRIRQLVSGGRPAGPDDVVRAEESVPDADHLPLSDERTRPVQTFGQLKDRLDAVVPAYDSADETGPSHVDAVEDLEASVRALGEGFPASDLAGLSAELGTLDATTLVDELVALRDRYTEEFVGLYTTSDGAIEAGFNGELRVRGETTLDPGTELFVRAVSGFPWPMMRVQTVIVGDDGIFEAQFNLPSVQRGGFHIAVYRLSANQPLAQAQGRYARVLSEHRPPSKPVALPKLAEVASRIDALAESDAGVKVDCALDSFDGPVVETAMGALPELDPEIRQGLTALLELDPLSLPGFVAHDEMAGRFEPWQALAPLLDRLASNEGLDREFIDGLTFLGDLSDSTNRAEFEADLDVVLSEFSTTLTQLQTAVEQSPTVVADFRVAVVQRLRETLYRLSYFGVPGSVPRSATGSTDAEETELLQQARSVWEKVAERHAEATNSSDRSAEKVEAVFDEGFVVLPSFEPPNSRELGQTLSTDNSIRLQNDDPLAVETWFQRAARIRDQPRSLQTAFTYGETFGELTPDETGARLRVGQLPYEDADEDTWVGLPEAWSPDDADRFPGRLSVVAHVDGSLDSEPSTAQGLFVDEWVESVPNTEETTGLTFEYDAPGARPPQSMLVAVPPNDAGWSVDGFADVVGESLNWAKLRTVDLEALTTEGVGHLLPALCYADNSLDDPFRVRAADTASIELDSLLSSDLRDIID